MLKENSKAPHFTLQDSFGKEHSLEDYKGKNVVIYFYPKDNTPGCTIEAIDFSNLKKDFEKKNTVILGVSKDSTSSHQKFVDKQNLTITLLSDPNSTMQKLYKVWKLKKFMGREFMGTVRSTYLIDEKGIIKKAWDNVKAKGHAQEVLKEL